MYGYRKALRELDRIEQDLGEGVTAKEFTLHCSTHMPIENARVYLHRLFKMNLASRRKDYASRVTKTPYRYTISNQGRRRLSYLKKQGKGEIPRVSRRTRRELDFFEQDDIVEYLEYLVIAGRYEEAIDWFATWRDGLTDEYELLFAQLHFHDAVQGLREEVHRRE